MTSPLSVRKRFCHYAIPSCLCFKTSPRAKALNENEFGWHENKPEGGTSFHMNDFARRVVLTQAP